MFSLVEEKYIDDRKKILEAISKQELYISKARKYLLDEKIDSDDFSKLKKEHNEIMEQLNHQLISNTQGCLAVIIITICG